MQLAEIRAFYTGFDGDPLSGTVIFVPRPFVSYAAPGTIVLPGKIVGKVIDGVLLDDDRVGPLELYSGVSYDVQERLTDGSGRQYPITVPEEAAANGADLYDLTYTSPEGVIVTPEGDVPLGLFLALAGRVTALENGGSIRVVDLDVPDGEPRPPADLVIWRTPFDPRPTAVSRDWWAPTVTAPTP